MREVTCDWIVKFAERIRATTDGSIPLSPIQASKQSEAHEELLKRVIASARRLRIDLDVSKPVNFYELGRRRAKAKGIRFGRKPKLTKHQREEALTRKRSGETLTAIAKSYNVSHMTICRLQA